MKTSLRDTDSPGLHPPGPGSAPDPLRDLLADPSRAAWVLQEGGRTEVREQEPRRAPGATVAFLPAVRPGDLGDRAFREAHGIRYACAAGAMANGIASVELVTAMARAGMLAFFGAAGLEPAQVADAVDRLRRDLGDLPFGVNLIHSPGDPGLEEAIVDLLLDRGVRLAEASAFLDLTPAVVRYRVHGLRVGPGGRVLARNRIVAKVSRVEVASRFLAPAPERILRDLLAAGRITAEEARLAAFVPVAEDLTPEADSGGHTDNRPLVALLPTMLALRDRMQERHAYATPPRVGAAGGIATPAAAAAAFSMGAGWILCGSVNQACVESGSSDAVREMLAAAEQADVAMAPAADMFEMGVKVQVLKRGTMFPMRAQRLHDLWRAHGSLESLPAAERESLERTVFRAPLEEVWRGTREWFLARDPSQVERAEREPAHRMALVFRWYLGMSSRWANAGEPTRRLDYQVWCGPAMGAFNEWTKGTFLAEPRNRRVAVVAANLVRGAAVLLRAGMLRAQGIDLPPGEPRAVPVDGDVLARDGFREVLRA
ncbi:MAG: PfaD family polyunsaturated fatty acid/polyketide biosynthesis protein [Planctomycetes bacterium]|nr:PfaD family polyunsaturated fatty acid/polyketide biosynthesis protein [Planctomycetota bacterium]